MFSVIIPTCHRNAELAECLKLLAPGVQTLVADLYEVIVSDDGYDSTAEAMVQEQFPWARWVQGPRRGPAANRNHGARQAGGEWLVFTDDDCLPSAGWLAAYDAAMADASCEVFEGATKAERPRQRMDEVAPLNGSGGYLWSCNFVIRRILFESIGKFDERFAYPAMEDVDLRFRLSSSHIKMAFVPLAVVIHPWRRHGGWRAIKRSVTSHHIYWSIHPEALSLRTTLHFCRGGATKSYQLIPEAWRFRGRGSTAAIKESVHWLWLGFASLRRLVCLSRNGTKLLPLR